MYSRSLCEIIFTNKQNYAFDVINRETFLTTQITQVHKSIHPNAVAELSAPDTNP